MSDEKTNVINNFPEGAGEATITILRGKAAEPLNRRQFSYTGRIDAPGNFYEARADKEQFTPADCVVTANYEDRTVELEIFPEFSEKNIQIDGKLQLDHRLERFGINNQATKYTRDELAQLFKFNRNAFNVVEEGMSFVKKLKDFKLKFDQAFEDRDDQRGGKKVVLERVIQECDLPETIALHLPIFKGEAEQVIVVDVLFHIAGSGDVVFYLESAELQEIIDKQSIKLIDKEIERFEGIAIIYE